MRRSDRERPGCRLGNGIAAALLALVAVETRPAQAAPFAFVPNFGSDDVSVIDTATNAVVNTIAVGRGPMAVAIDASGTRVYIANSKDDTVSVIDTAAQTVATTIPVCLNGNYIHASTLALSADGATAYVGCGFPGEIDAIDTTTFEVTDKLVGASYDFVQGMAVDVVGARLYAQLRTDFGGGQLVSVDSTSLNVVTVATMPSDSFTAITLALSPALTTSGLRVLAPHPAGTVLRIFDTLSQTVQPVALPSQSSAVVVNQAATVAYVAMRNNTVAVVDVPEQSFVTAIVVGNGPRGLSLSADERRLYVANSGSNTVSVIDTVSQAVIATIPVGEQPIAAGRFIARPPGCGDGYVDDGEACDAGDANGTDASCCTMACAPARSGSPCADDGNPCTGEVCDASGICQHPPQAASCDDGVFCNGADSCADGSCSVHRGDPCIFGPQCTATCNEATANCQSPDDTICDSGSGIACRQRDRCRTGVCVSNGAGDSDGDLVCQLDDNCPDTANQTQANSDRDRLGDACDPCNNPDRARTFLDHPNPIVTVLRRSDFLSGSEYDTFRLTAEFRLPDTVAFKDLPLVADGARITFLSWLSDVVSDARIPGGALQTRSAQRGWRLDARGRRWFYRDRTATPIAGIRSIVLTDSSSESPGLVRARIRADGHVIRANQLPRNVALTLGGETAAAAGWCAESDYSGELDCAYDNLFRRWSCQRR